MKKVFYIVAFIATLFVSCTADDSIATIEVPTAEAKAVEVNSRVSNEVITAWKSLLVTLETAKVQMNEDIVFWVDDCDYSSTYNAFDDTYNAPVLIGCFSDDIGDYGYGNGIDRQTTERLHGSTQDISAGPYKYGSTYDAWSEPTLLWYEDADGVYRLLPKRHDGCIWPSDDAIPYCSGGCGPVDDDLP